MKQPWSRPLGTNVQAPKYPLPLHIQAGNSASQTLPCLLILIPRGKQLAAPWDKRQLFTLLCWGQPGELGAAGSPASGYKDSKPKASRPKAAESADSYWSHPTPKPARDRVASRTANTKTPSAAAEGCILRLNRGQRGAGVE